jgi:putative nucleotidyltransferase with HDIG domain
MRSLILTVDQDNTILQYHQLLRFNLVREDILGAKLSEVASRHREFRDLEKAIETLDASDGVSITLVIREGGFFDGFIRGLSDEQIAVSVSRTDLAGEKITVITADYSSQVHERITLIEEKERLSVEAVNMLREVSRTVLNEVSPKVAARKSLELVSNLFHARMAEFRVYSNGKADVYGSWGIPYGYLGRNGQILVERFPMYQTALSERRAVVSEDTENDLGTLFPELQEIHDIRMAACLPAMRKDRVIGFLVLFFEQPYAIVRESLDILENVVSEFDFLIQKNEYYSEIIQTSDKLKKLSLDIVTSLSDAIETRDSYTNGHSKRVAIYSVEIARNMGWDDYELERLSIAAILHDIGKVGIPDAVLLKPTPLNSHEYDIMKLHPELSANIVSKIENFQELVGWVRYHHEHLDGSGYPYGLRGNEIPMAARVIAVADAYDAMTSDRPYRKAMPMESVIEVLREGAGTQWDAEVVEISLRNLEVLPKDVAAMHNIQDKLEDFRRMIFNVSLLSGLYLYEYVYEEAERSLESGKNFSLAHVSLDGQHTQLSRSERKRMLHLLIDLCRAELHYPVLVARYDYYQLMVYAPQMQEKFLRGLLAKVQIRFFEQTDIYFTITSVSSEDKEGVSSIMQRLFVGIQNASGPAA